MEKPFNRTPLEVSKLITQRFEYFQNQEDQDSLTHEGGLVYDDKIRRGEVMERTRETFIRHWYNGHIKDIAFSQMSANLRRNSQVFDKTKADTYNHDVFETDAINESRILNKMEVKTGGQNKGLLTFMKEENNKKMVDLRVFLNNSHLLGHVIFAYLEPVPSRNSFIIITKWIMDAPTFESYTAPSKKFNYPKDSYYYMVDKAKSHGMCVELDPITGAVI